MNTEDNQDRERDVRDKIVKLMKSIGQARRKPVADEEARKLKSAARRLDQLLKVSTNADRDALRNAASRLDQLLADIHKGKDIAEDLKRRRSTGSREE